MLLIPIDKDGNLEENGWREIPEFSDLSKRFGDKGMKAVILAWDSGSVYSRFSEEERERKAVINQIGKQDADVFIKSKQYQVAKYLYRSLDYDELIDSRRVQQEKLMDVNRMIERTPMLEGNLQKIEQLTKQQKALLTVINEITVKIEERGVKKKDLKMLVLSGIERFYKKAKENRTEDLLYRNKIIIERRNLALEEAKKKELADKKAQEELDS